MSEINWSVIKQKVINAKSVLITSHQSPDGDAVGSALALHNYFKLIGVSSQVLLPDAFPLFYNWMENSGEIILYDSSKIEADKIINSADVIFSLDYNDLKRVGEMGEVIANSDAHKIMIDHHLYPSDFADTTFSDSNKCSTAQMIFEVIELMGDSDQITPEIGACIYTGLVTDTGSFRFSSVDEKTHEIAGFLIKNGLKQHLVHEAIFNQNSLDRVKLRGFILSEKLQHFPELKSTIISLSIAESERFNIQSGDTEGLVNTALSIKGTEVAAFFRESDDKIKISFRSIGDTKVNELSGNYFHGGGHKNAAGGMSKLGLEETIELFKSVVHEII